MKLEQQVCNLELSQKLKELRVKQESLFYWRLGYSTSESFDKGVSLGKKGIFSDKYELTYYPKPRYTTADVKWNERDLAKLNETELSAFTVAELGEMLPDEIEIKEQSYWMHIEKVIGNEWGIGYRINGGNGVVQNFVCKAVEQTQSKKHSTRVIE